MPFEPLPPASTGLYKQAPAVEVIYNIRGALPETVDPKVFLDVIQAELPNEFAEHQDFQTVQGAVTFKFGKDADNNPESNVRLNVAGYRCTSADKSFVAHYLVQGLILNFLPPYAGYGAAMARLKDHWAVYKKAVGDVPITALSMRYIDRIDIPLVEGAQNFDLDEYFTIVSKLPEGLSAHHCYQQYWLNDSANEIRARVIWSSLDNLPGHVSFALDTEAILDPANIVDVEEAWRRFDDLHAWCTHVFNHSLTAKCKALFK